MPHAPQQSKRPDGQGCDTHEPGLSAERIIRHGSTILIYWLNHIEG
ncbi:MAG: hypothetical protein CDV28_10380 [Candidatus Electronema aureum]|uniref:Uncharacterized protein n=1 Tax=Candidatus Electronema aureum TaxID=2005002 RepID=A0A521G4N0_9BACT|nr:MAG: hypothetical protein CDV28_10380 [Candidatus Electronema aureum]